MDQNEKRRPLTRTLLRIAIVVMLAAFCFQSGFSEGRAQEKEQQYDARMAEARERIEGDFRERVPAGPLNAVEGPAWDANTATPLEESVADASSG